MLLVHVILIIAAIVRSKTTSTSTCLMCGPFSSEGCIGDIGKSSHLAFFHIHALYEDVYLHACMWNVVMCMLR